MMEKVNTGTSKCRSWYFRTYGLWRLKLRVYTLSLDQADSGGMAP